MARTDILDRSDDIREWVKAKESKAFMCQQLQCKPSTLNNYLSKLGIQYAGNQSNKGKKFGYKYPIEEYLKINGKYKSSHALKLRLYDEGIKSPECEDCHIKDWNGKELSFHLDHDNGNHFDNTLSNLKIRCPNCHSQTPTYAGKKRI